MQAEQIVEPGDTAGVKLVFFCVLGSKDPLQVVIQTRCKLPDGLRVRKGHPDEVVVIFQALALVQGPQLGKKEILEVEDVIAACATGGVDCVGASCVFERSGRALIACPQDG